MRRQLLSVQGSASAGMEGQRRPRPALPFCAWMCGAAWLRREGKSLSLSPSRWTSRRERGAGVGGAGWEKEQRGTPHAMIYKEGRARWQGKERDGRQGKPPAIVLCRATRSDVPPWRQQRKQAPIFIMLGEEDSGCLPGKWIDTAEDLL